MAKLPKRAAKEHRSHAKRQRSYAKSLNKKEANKTNARTAEMLNRAVGYTGKDRDNALRKAFGKAYRVIKRNIQSGNVSYSYLKSDDNKLIPVEDF